MKITVDTNVLISSTFWYGSSFKIIEKVENISTIIEPEQKFNIIKDDVKDNKIIECAIGGNVDYIISQDNHLLKLKECGGINIVLPEDFLKIIRGL